MRKVYFTCIKRFIHVSITDFEKKYIEVTGLLGLTDLGFQLPLIWIIKRPKEHHPALPKHRGKKLKDRPPQQIVGHCGSCIIAPLRAAHAATPVLQGYDPSSEVGPKSHTTIIVPSGGREPAYLYGSLSSANTRCPPRWGG
ncbi:hypothetical protein AVEN_2669-1 [Araneus ventricosus]|uniref:Uncharacterized protein n=1 Tax=Araneus ventricosus TaxID=182803 RepID=A0A4Y2PNI7_ARAVE|nr:hypothetical protein AVEN_2669-1 [Araneus ventricosus]